jgi:CotH kinase protein/Secretion system C-terminal sorting domain
MKKIIQKLFLVIFCTISIIGKAQLSESNLPIIVINTTQTIIDPFKVPGTIEIFDKSGSINRLTDKATAKYDIGIEYRGSSSQGFPKKPYGFETRTDKGVNLNVSLLGLPAENDWVLISPYSDKSLIRDQLTYRLCRAMGRYTSNTKFVELIVNGQYLGVYFLGEKIKQGKNRVDIAKLKITDNTGDDVTGGYIVKIDKTTGGASRGWNSNYYSSILKVYFQVDYPKIEDITDQQFTYIKNYVNNFEDRLKGNDFKDPEKGYAKVIDSDSFVDYFLINELTRNVDGYRLSTYMHKEKDSKGGKLTMGPAWDFNLAFGNADYCDGWKTFGWAYQFNDACPSDGAGGVPFWWARLLNDDKFQLKLKSRWKDLRKDALSNNRINSLIDSSTNLLKDAQIRNFNKWPIWSMYVWPNKYIASNYADEINYTKNWIKDRLAFMDQSDLLSSEILAIESPLIDANAISVYPNPIEERSKVGFSIFKNEPVSVNIFDLSGKNVATILDQQMPIGSFEFPIPKNKLTAGTYIVKLEKSNKFISSKKIFVN